MIRVDGHWLFREGKKIGFVDDKYIKDRMGDKVGYVQGNFVHDMDGHKLAYLQGDYICFLKTSHKIRIEDNEKEVQGGDLTNIQKAAVSVLLGE